MPPIEYIIFGICALFFLGVLGVVGLAIVVKLSRGAAPPRGRNIVIGPRVGNEPSLLDLVDSLTSGEDLRRRRQRLTDRLYDLASDSPPAPPKA